RAGGRPRIPGGPGARAPGPLLTLVSSFIEDQSPGSYFRGKDPATFQRCSQLARLKHQDVEGERVVYRGGNAGRGVERVPVRFHYYKQVYVTILCWNTICMRAKQYYFLRTELPHDLLDNLLNG